MIKNGAKVNLMKDELSPLHHAAMNCHENVTGNGTIGLFSIFAFFMFFAEFLLQQYFWKMEPKLIAEIILGTHRYTKQRSLVN